MIIFYHLPSILIISCFLDKQILLCSSPATTPSKCILNILFSILSLFPGARFGCEHGFARTQPRDIQTGQQLKGTPFSTSASIPLLSSTFFNSVSPFDLSSPPLPPPSLPPLLLHSRNGRLFLLPSTLFRRIIKPWPWQPKHVHSQHWTSSFVRLRSVSLLWISIV